MNKHKDIRGVSAPSIVIAVLAVVIIAGTGYFAIRPQSSPSGTAQAPVSEKKLPDGTMVKPDGTIVKTDGTMIKPNEAIVKNEDEPTVKSTVTGYVDYSAAAFAAAKDQKRVLFFHAVWCPTCKAANMDLTANTGKIPSDVVVFKTDYDSERELKAKYGITYQHTYVQVDVAGNAVTKWNGGGVNEILRNIQ